MKATFENTVNILVKAYINETLEHANCAACAVGNLIAHAKGVIPILMDDTNYGELYHWSNGEEPLWQRVFCTHSAYQQIHPDQYFGTAKEQIDITGYSWEQLARIEEAFESKSDRININHQSRKYKDKLQFNGLMAVVTVLAEIHGVDLETAENARKMFVKA